MAAGLGALGDHGVGAKLPRWPPASAPSAITASAPSPRRAACGRWSPWRSRGSPSRESRATAVSSGSPNWKLARAGGSPAPPRAGRRRTGSDRRRLFGGSPRPRSAYSGAPARGSLCKLGRRLGRSVTEEVEVERRSVAERTSAACSRARPPSARRIPAPRARQPRHRRRELRVRGIRHRRSQDRMPRSPSSAIAVAGSIGRPLVAVPAPVGGDRVRLRPGVEDWIVREVDPVDDPGRIEDVDVRRARGPRRSPSARAARLRPARRPAPRRRSGRRGGRRARRAGAEGRKPPCRLGGARISSWR